MAPHATRLERKTTLWRASAAASAAALAAGLVVATPAEGSTGGQLHTVPVDATLNALTANGSASGILGNQIDLPVMLGDEGTYTLAGVEAPVGDSTGNGVAGGDLPAGPIDGTLYDPEDGDLETTQGRGVSITGGSDHVRRTPAGLSATTTVTGVEISLEGLNDNVAAVLERDVVATVGSVTTLATASVSGAQTVTTQLTDLTLLGETIALVDGRLAEPASRSLSVDRDDPESLMRSLGMDEDDIDQYAGLLNSAHLIGEFTMTAATPASGGLVLTARMDLQASADAGSIFGGANLHASNDVFEARIAHITGVASPAPIEPTAVELDSPAAELEDAVTLTGTGFVPGATTVRLGGAAAPITDVAADGTTLTFTVPDGMTGGIYPVSVTTPGGTAQAGTLRVIGEDTVPLRVDAVTPTQSNDGAVVELTGAGLVADGLSVTVVDADDVTFAVSNDSIIVAESGVSAEFVLPEGLALGDARIVVELPGEVAETAITIVPLTLDPLPATGSANVIGRQEQQFSVSLTEDNSSVVTWGAPRLINPAGTSATGSELTVNAPGSDEFGSGNVSATGAGLTGTVDRTFHSLTANAHATGYSLSLPSTWAGFFGTDAIVTADSISATAQASAVNGASEDVSMQNLRVLGNVVPLVDGKVTGTHEFTLTRNRDYLRNNRSMDGVFFSAAGGAYDEIQSSSHATLHVTISPAPSSVSATSASTGAFVIDADITYRYEGENGGWLSTRARHGTGGSRNGERVNLYNATVAQVSATAPAVAVPDVVTASPSTVAPGDTVTLTGRAFSADAVVQFGSQNVTPTAVASNGQSLTFTVPDNASNDERTVIHVSTSGGVSSTFRTLLWKSAPQFESHPEDVTVGLDEDAVFSVSATGVPAPTLQWQHNTGTGWGDLAGETGASLTVTGALEGHGTEYRAVAANEMGEVTSDAAQLTIEAPPAIVAGPEDLDVREGEQATFVVDYTAVPAAEVTWQIDRGEGFVTVPDATGDTLEFEATPEDNGALVRATLTNAVGTVQTEPAQLLVAYAPRITQQPAPAVVTEGDTATFAVVADANPAPTFRWQFRHALGGDWQSVDSDANPTALTATLELPTALSYDGLRFRAMVHSPGADPVFTDPVELTVNPDVVEPGADGVSVLGSPFRVGAIELIGTGEAVGGGMSDLLNGYLVNGVEIGESGVFALPEAGTPAQVGTEVTEYAAGVPTGSGIGDLDAGVNYGDTTVTTTWDAEGILTKTDVADVTVTHFALDDKGRIGELLGIDELVHATGVSSQAVALLDNDAATFADGSIESLRVLGTELDEADGLVDGRLAGPVTLSTTIQIEDPAEVMERLDVDLSAFVEEDLLGGAQAHVNVTVSQPLETDADTALAMGLHVEVEASLDAEIETQGGDRFLFENVTLSTEGFQQMLELEVAKSVAARNGASLPEPDDGTGSAGPGDDEKYPLEDPAEPVDIETYTPSLLPERLISTPTTDMSTTRQFSWRTSAEVTSAVVEYRIGDQEVTVVTAQTGSPVTRTASDSTGEYDWSIRAHSALLTGLTPATEYTFRVGDGAEAWSQWRTFTTASEQPEPFTFLYFGDGQNNLHAYWAEAARQAYAAVPEAELVLHAGDMINHSDNDLEWAEWFAASPDDMAQKVHMPVSGNHEFTSGMLGETWHDSFVVPGNGPTPNLAAEACLVAYEKHIAQELDGLVYYYDYQGVRFVSLSGTWSVQTSTPPGSALAAEGCTDPAGINGLQVWLDMQARWLDAVLADNPGMWSVVSIHQPLYSVSTGRDNTFLRDTFGPIIEKHNVDLMLQGHDHTYGRGHLFANEVPGREGISTGPEYVVSVLGPKAYEVDHSDNNEWLANGANRVAVYEKTRTYQKITVNGGHLTYTAYEYPTDEVVDSFEICKTNDGNKFVATGGAVLPDNCSMELPEVGYEQGPSVTGTPQVGEVLTADAGVWDEGATLALQWLADGDELAGSTGDSLTLTDEHVGAQIAVRVTATKSAHAPTQATSTPTAPVAATSDHEDEDGEDGGSGGDGGDTGGDGDSGSGDDTGDGDTETPGGADEPGDEADPLTPKISLWTTTVRPGQSIMVGLSGLDHTQVEVGVASTYQRLATAQLQGGSAVLTVTIPADIELGQHHLQVRDQAGNVLLQEPITVVAQASGAPGSAGEQLSRTGAETLSLVVIAIALLGIGVVALWTGRTRGRVVRGEIA